MKRFGELVINPLAVAAVLPSHKFSLTGSGTRTHYDVLLHSGAMLIVRAADAQLLMAELVPASAPPTSAKEI